MVTVLDWEICCPLLFFRRLFRGRFFLLGSRSRVDDSEFNMCVFIPLGVSGDLVSMEMRISLALLLLFYWEDWDFYWEAYRVLESLGRTGLDRLDLLRYDT